MSHKIIGLVQSEPSPMTAGPSTLDVKVEAARVVVGLRQPRGRMVEVAMLPSDALLLARRLARSSLLMPAVTA